jgi:MFS family permease
VLAGRTPGSRLARRYHPARLLALALAVAAAGFAILWPSTGPAQALVGLCLLGLGLGNLFPMGVSVAVALAPRQAVLASGRTVMMSSFAVVLAPLTVGTLADATSLKLALRVVRSCSCSLRRGSRSPVERRLNRAERPKQQVRHVLGKRQNWPLLAAGQIPRGGFHLCP